MKKIFAFILAAIMVASLVPATAFAAIIKEEPCPDVHTVANCDAVILSTVNADCENPGYTIFKCIKCNEQFIGNIVAAGSHNWVLDKKHEDTNIPKCTEGKVGVGHYDCSVCGEEKTEEIEIASLHKLKYVTGVGCEAAYRCSVCKETFNSNGGELGEHEGWELTTVISEPTAKKTGLALFTCTKKDCKATKEVVINAQCECHDINTPAKFYNAYSAGKLVLKTKPTEVTCDNAGRYAIYACADCGRFYRWKTSDSTNSIELPDPILNDDGQVIGIKNGVFGHVETNDERYYAIEALGHSYDEDKKTVVNTCSYTYYCTRCKKDIAQDGHSWFDISSTEATCETYGITYKVCRVCGLNKNDVIAPLGHDLNSETYESTCGTYGYIITYCKNGDNCTYGVPVVGMDGSYYDISTGKIYKDVTVTVDGVKVLRPIINIVPLTELKGSHTFTTTQIIGGSSSSCENGLLVMQQCKYCNYVTYKQVASKGHTYGETTTIPATCTSTGSIIKTCGVCGYVDILVLPKLTTHEYETIKIEYLCSEKEVLAGTPGPDGRYYHGIRYVACKHGCIGTETTTYIDAVGNASANVWFESLEEAHVYHGAGNLTLLPNSYRAPSCASAGYGIYSCSKCSKTIYITTPAVGHVPTISAAGLPITIAGKPATCTATGLKPYNLCATCNGMITLNDKGEYVTITSAELVTNPHSATLEEIVINSCDNVNFVIYYKCNVKGCGKLFADKTATTPVDELPVAKAHTWKTIYSGVVLNCNNDGYPEIRYCTTCKTLEKTQYAEFVKNGKVVVDIYGSVETWSIEEYAIPTVLNYTNGTFDRSAYRVAKYSHGEADNCPAEWAGLIMNHKAYYNEADCDEEYGYIGHRCLICNYEYITDFVPAAGGHYNTYGEKLEESCANYVAVKDRICVNCDKPIGTDKDLHNVVKGETVKPTCSSEGYTFSYCKNDGCTWVEVIDPTPAVKPATYHKNTANLKVGGVEADYATVGNSYTYCPICLDVIKVNKETTLSDAGLEIYLSSDAESYIPGATVYVTVTLDSLKGVDVWGVNFPITYNPAVFKYVGYTFNAANSAFQTFSVNAAQTYNTFNLNGATYTKGDLTDAGVVVVAASADDEVTIKGSQLLATFEFKVISYAGANAEEAFAVEKKSIVSGLALGEYISDSAMYAIDATKSTVKTYAPDVVDGAGKAVPVNAPDSTGKSINSVVVNVGGFLDLDGKSGITMADAHALYALIYNNGYDATADADFDGKITARDLNVLYNILIGQITVEEYLNSLTSEAK